MNRDPIGERGGWNLYGFVGNDGVNLFDIFWKKPSCSNSDDYSVEDECLCTGSGEPKCPGCKCLEFFLINTVLKGQRAGVEDIWRLSKTMYKAVNFDGTIRMLPEDKLPVFEPAYYDDHGTKKKRGNEKAIRWVFGSRWKDSPECKVCRGEGKGGVLTVQIALANRFVGGTILPKGTAVWNKGNTITAGMGRRAVIGLPALNNRSWLKGWAWPTSQDWREAEYKFSVIYSPENGAEKKECFGSRIPLDMGGWATDLKKGVTDGG